MSLEDKSSPNDKKLHPVLGKYSSLSEALGDVEKEIISNALVYYRWNRRVVAKSLGLSYSTLIRKVEYYDLEKTEAIPFRID